MKKLSFQIILVLLSLSVSNVFAELRLPAIISDNMVLQSEMKTPVWGWATPGENIEVEFNGKFYKTVTDKEGNWGIKMNNLISGGPYTMTIKSVNEQITIKNILVGEVWLASGQSNMEFGIQTELNGDNAIREANDSLIRFFYVPMAASLHEKKDIDGVKNSSLNGKWVVCSPENMSEKWAWHGFSAIGYYFAQEIRKTSKKAVGVIGSYKGGTEAQTWISQKGFSLPPALPKYQEAHCKLVEDAEKNNRRADYRGSSNLYNAMIAPILPYGIRGVIWYQGESNADNLEEAAEYVDIFPRLIKDWRNNWNQGDFPFLYVQLPNFRKPSQTPSEGNWPWVREAQQKTLSIKNTGMAVAIDLGDAEDIHPKAKKEVGRRLALVADNMLYEKKKDSSVPVYHNMKIKGAEITLSFKSLGDGLTRGDLKGFGIASSDGKFVWANAISDGEKIVVFSPDVSNPVAVRYNWGDNPSGNLYGENGLPASPFRTDNWPAQNK